MTIQRNSERVYVVTVDDRQDGVYIFRYPSDADDFEKAVRSWGGSCTMIEEPIIESTTAIELIAQERKD